MCRLSTAMREKLDEPGRDWRLADLAARQHGVVERCSAARARVSRDNAIATTRSGGLAAPGASWRVRGRPPAPDAPWPLPGCCLFVPGRRGPQPPQCCRSLESASRAGTPGRRDRPGGARRGGRDRDRPPLTAERSRRTIRHGIPVTTPARTMLDLAAVVSDREFERAMDEAAYLRLDLSGLQPRPGRRGGAGSRASWPSIGPAPRRTRTKMEERMLALCRLHGLPAPLVNEVVEGYTSETSSGPSSGSSWKPTAGRPTAQGRPSRATASAMPTSSLPAGARCDVTWKRLTNEPAEVADQLQATARPSATDPAAPCRWCAAPAGPHAPGARQTARRSRPSAAAARRAAARSNRSANGSSTISGRPRQCISQKPTTPRLLRIRRPVSSVFCSRDAIP